MKMKQLNYEEQKEFASNYDTLASYFGGDKIQLHLSGLTQKQKLKWLVTNRKRLEKVQKEGLYGWLDPQSKVLGTSTISHHGEV